MSWVILTIFGALMQAVGLAVKKHVLTVPGINALIALVIFITAGGALMIAYFIVTGGIWYDGELSTNFWIGILIAAGLNTIATGFSYRALEKAELSYLSPYSAFTTFLFVLPPLFLLGEVPRIGELLGMGIIVVGVFVMEYRGQDTTAHKEQHKKNRQALGFFAIATVFYSLTPTGEKMAILASDPLFASAITHIAIAIFFVPFFFAFQQHKKINTIRAEMSVRRFIGFLILAGLIAAMANSSVHFALEQANVASVVALKRIMPLFAFFIGFYIFHERVRVKNKLIATIIMIIGAVVISVSS